MATNTSYQRTIEHYQKYHQVVKDAFTDPSKDKIIGILLYLDREGLGRRDIYGLLKHLNFYDEGLSEAQSDHIEGILCNLCCENRVYHILSSLKDWSEVEGTEGLENFIRFSDDPDNWDEFLSYLPRVAYGWPERP